MLKFQAPPVSIARKPVVGLREASIDVGVGNTVNGVHRTSFQNFYTFGFFDTFEGAASPGQYRSLIHAGLASRGVDQTQGGGRAAYFNADALDTGSKSDETFQTFFSPPDIAAQAVQVPLHGANKLSFALSVWSDQDPFLDRYNLVLCRQPNSLDSVAYMGGGGNPQVVAQWGPITSSKVGSQNPNFVVDGYTLPVGSTLYLKLTNITNPAHDNRLVGSIFFHG